MPDPQQAATGTWLQAWSQPGIRGEFLASQGDLISKQTNEQANKNIKYTNFAFQSC